MLLVKNLSHESAAVSSSSKGGTTVSMSGQEGAQTSSQTTHLRSLRKERNMRAT